SGIAIDQEGRVYACASDGVHEFSPDLSSGSLLAGTRRASGIAVGTDGRVYMSDQILNRISVIFSPSGTGYGSIPTGMVPQGIGVAPDGSIYYVDTPFQSPTDYLGRLVRVNPTTFSQQVIFSNLPFPTDIDFLPDGT